VRQLDSRHRSLFSNKGKHTTQRLYVVVCPDAKVLRTDACICRDGRGFRYDGSGASYGSAPKMDEMPVRGKAINAGILAHRGNNDAVRKFHAAEPEGFE
jgi:hypothetical protein